MFTGNDFGTFPVFLSCSMPASAYWSFASVTFICNKYLLVVAGTDFESNHKLKKVVSV
jgi:hypothetical protein